MKVEEVYKLKPLNNKIILKQNKIVTSSSGIILIADKAEKESFCEVIESDSDFVSKGDIVYTDPYTGIKLCETDDAVYILMDEDDILCRKEK